MVAPASHISRALAGHFWVKAANAQGITDNSDARLTLLPAITVITQHLGADTLQGLVNGWAFTYLWPLRQEEAFGLMWSNPRSLQRSKLEPRARCTPGPGTQSQTGKAAGRGHARPGDHRARSSSSEQNPVSLPHN